MVEQIEEMKEEIKNLQNQILDLKESHEKKQEQIGETHISRSGL